MKKILIASAIALVMAGSANAESNKEGEKWVGGFYEYYSTDHKEIHAPNYLDNGESFGLELGFKMQPNWGVRFEFAHLNLDTVAPMAGDISSNRVGVDVLHFLPENLMYAFGGIRHTHFTESEQYFNLGVGKHWDLNDKVKIITEVIGYQNLNTGNTDVGYKLGLAYVFGASSSSAPVSVKDSDKDGVNDNKDQCANTPYGTKVDSTGCAIVSTVAKVADSDNDGVADNEDNCANTPSTDKVDAKGCSIFTEEQVSVDIKVLFGKNSSVVTNPSDIQFQNFVDFMNRYPATDVIIEGHASAPGNANYNMELSEGRAKSVRALLVDRYGLDANRITAKGFGESQLLDTSNTAAAHKTNRRITAKVTASKRLIIKK